MVQSWSGVWRKRRQGMQTRARPLWTQIVGRCVARHMFSNFVKETLGFKPTTMDPDVYLRKSYKSESGEAYYEYLLVYVDDILVFGEKHGRQGRGTAGGTVLAKRDGQCPSGTPSRDAKSHTWRHRGTDVERVDIIYYDLTLQRTLVHTRRIEGRT